MSKPYVEAEEVKGVGKILRYDAPFDDCLTAFKDSGAKFPMTSRQVALARINAPNGKEDTLNTRGSYNRAGFAYAKGELPLRFAVSPLLTPELAKLATQANRENRYFSTDASVYENAKKIAERDASKEPEKRAVIALPSRDYFVISPKQNSEVFRAIFGKQGEKYLQFIGRDSVTVYPVAKGTVDSQDGTILTQEWLARLDLVSNVNGLDRCLNDDLTVRGVLPVTGGASSQKISSGKVLPYTLSDVRTAERELKRLTGFLQPKQFEGLKGLVAKLRGKQ